jgi:hypothetical protein
MGYDAVSFSLLTRSEPTLRVGHDLLVLDRDLNAAIDLEHLAGSFLGQSKRSVRAAGSGTRRKPCVQLVVRKQEPNAKYGLSTLG